MTPDTVFGAVNGLAFAGWILLAGSPWLPRVAATIAGVAVPVALSLLYAALVATQWAGSQGGFGSLADVALLFDNRWMLLAGWTHYLAFDLLVGNWERRDAVSRGLPHLLLLPCLAMTFLFGPAGWLLYLAVRTVRRSS